MERLRRSQQSTFRALTGDCGSTLEVVARFLALLELFREGLVAFEQMTPLGELYVRWSGQEEGSDPSVLNVGAEFDDDAPAVGSGDQDQRQIAPEEPA
jgi:segregation and condensation protein A